MKKILFGVALLATAIFATSCKNDGSNEPDPSKYKLAISNVTYNSAEVLIAPADTSISYLWGVYEKDTLDKYGDAALDSIMRDLKNSIDSYNEEMKLLLEMYGLEWSDEYAATVADYLRKGEVKDTINGLKEETKYFLFLVEMDTTGKALSELYTKAFETLSFVASSDMTINITINGTEVTYTPSNNTETYYYNWTTKATLAYYGFNDITAFAEDDIVYYGEEIENYLSKGAAVDDVADYEAEGYVAAGDSVIAYAFGYKDGARTTDVFSADFIYKAKLGAPARKKMQRFNRSKDFVRPAISRIF
jgi:hypothetical protein